MAKITYYQDNNANAFLGLATIAMMLTMVVTVLGIKFRWFKRQMSFQPVTPEQVGVMGINGTYRSSVDLSNSISQGIFRMKNDEDNVIERPKSLPPIRVRKTSREPPPPLLPQKRTVTPKPPGQELIPETPLTEVAPPIFFPRVKKSPSINPPATLFENPKEEETLQQSEPSKVVLLPPVHNPRKKKKRPQDLPLIVPHFENVTPFSATGVPDEETASRQTADSEYVTPHSETTAVKKHISFEGVSDEESASRQHISFEALPDEETASRQPTNFLETYECVTSLPETKAVKKHISFEDLPDEETASRQPTDFPEPNAVKKHISFEGASDEETASRRPTDFLETYEGVTPLPETNSVKKHISFEDTQPTYFLETYESATTLPETNASKKHISFEGVLDEKTEKPTSVIGLEEENELLINFTDYLEEPVRQRIQFESSPDLQDAQPTRIDFDSEEEFTVVKFANTVLDVPTPVPRQRSINKTEYVPPLPKTPPPPSYPEMQSTSWSAIEIHRNLTKELNDELKAVTAKRAVKIEPSIPVEVEPPPRNMRDMMKRRQKQDFGGDSSV